MRLVIKCLFVAMYGLGGISYAWPLSNDQEAYAYCITHKDSFIAIVWPIMQGHDDKIHKILNKYGTIKYQKKVLLTPEAAYQLLEAAHYNAGIKNWQQHLEWYFPPGTFEKMARIFVLKCKDTKTATKCKYAVRNLVDLQYRAIHINDTHDETVELARFFFIS